MKISLQELVAGMPIRSAAYRVDRAPKRYLTDSACQYRIPSLEGAADSKRKNKIGKKGHSFVHGFREHVRHGPKISETVKGKLSLGARILRVGGVDKVFKRFFSVKEGEKLLKASQCYLSTTAGPIAGLLFISTEKVAFCSERSMKISSPDGDMTRIHYKVTCKKKKKKSFILLSLAPWLMLSNIESNIYPSGTGLDSTEEDRESKSKRECEETFRKVHGNSYSGQF
ncbi:GEM-like protein 7 isoform X1 [Juglans microcarpa x Juglans regia]|uniref:GEM-like protein 7 isoform X1 n=1 Tax=Juglans microcarpa x Juglans regia TaxID=2249226 RepID=UPI001B7E6C9E|nr:GEM-like protein 7 isoform X1 [Juglans microcarpa x Juglans regia]